jgi:hypothetical protein
MRRPGRLSLPAIAAASVASGSAALITSQVWGKGTLVAAALSPLIVALLSELLEGASWRLPDLPYRLKIALLTAVIAFAVAASLLTAPELITGKSLARGDRATTYFGGEEEKSTGLDASGQTVGGEPSSVANPNAAPLAAPSVPESVTFEQTTVGVPVSAPVEVTNPNSSAISLTGIEVVGDESQTSSPGDFSHDGACSTVAPGTTCSITVTFLPQPAEPSPPEDGVPLEVATRSALLRIADDGTRSAQAIPLVGQVIVQPLVPDE